MKPLYAVSLFTFALLTSVFRAPEDGKPVSIFLVRHAETAGSTHQGSDPELSPDGELRAQALARLLSPAGVTHLFASEYARTRATLAPLATQRELGVEVVPAREPAELVAALRALPPGSVAVVAGHSNTVPELVRALGAEAAGSIEHEQYDRLFLVLVREDPDEPVHSLELRYGT